MPATKTNLINQFLKNLKRVLALIWQTDKRISIILFILLIVISLFPIVFSYIFKLLIDEIVKEQSLAMAITAALLSIFTFRYLLDLFYELGATYAYDYLDKIIRYKLENKTTIRFVEKMSQLDMPHFENSETQSLIQKARQAYPWRIMNFYSYLFNFFEPLITFIGSVIVLLPFGFWIPFVMAAATMPRLFFRNKYIKTEWIKFNQNIEASKELGYLRSLLDYPQSVKEIRVAQAGKALLDRLDKIQTHIFKTLISPLKGYLPAFYFSIFFEIVILFILAYLKLPLVVAGAITLGSFTFYIQMLDGISRSSRGIVSQLTRLLEQNLYVGYFFDALELPKIIMEKIPGMEFKEIKPPEIEFKNVNFSYEGGPEVLKNISFALEPGKHLAIVGPNGAGKTTLIKLLLRFYDPNRGRILINEVDLRDLKLSNWYKFVSILFQDFVQFSLSIKDNILLGDSSLIDNKKMLDAAEKSGAREFIEKFPKKYDQRLGKRFEDSVELSQGQWQRLALARAFYEAAPILILDEPTSSIDVEAEAQIFDNLYKAYKGKTLILISHRFSTVRNADKIIVLQNGEITEEGNHRFLMEKDGVYARMFKKQARGYID